MSRIKHDIPTVIAIPDEGAMAEVLASCELADSFESVDLSNVEKANEAVVRIARMDAEIERQRKEVKARPWAIQRSCQARQASQWGAARDSA